MVPSLNHVHKHTVASQIPDYLYLCFELALTLKPEITGPTQDIPFQCIQYGLLVIYSPSKLIFPCLIISFANVYLYHFLHVIEILTIHAQACSVA